MRRLATAAILLCVAITSRTVAVDVVIDYTFAPSFFSESTTNGQQARASVEAAADYFSEILDGSLAEIEKPDDFQSTVQGAAPLTTVWNWTARFTNPTTGQPTELTNPVFQADEYRIYVGARDLPGVTRGQGGPGGWSKQLSPYYLQDEAAVLEIDQAFTRLLTNRDREDGEFGRWGGVLTFDTGATWNYDHNAPPSSGESDLFSVAIHEIGHALGFGLVDEFESQVFAGTFTGAASIAANGDAAPRLDPLEAHWRDGTMSTIYGTTTPQETAMDPTITTGTRKLWTTLDAAALADIGWSITLPVLGLPGDYNNDGLVDAADYTTWRDNLGSPDAIGTYNEWTSNYGASSAQALSTAVPEPSSVAAIVLATAASIACNRRNAH